MLVNNKWTNENKIKLLPNGVTKNNYNRNNDVINSKNITVVGSVANFRPQKDHRTLVKAFAILSNKFVNTELWLVGDGPLKPEIEKLVKELGIESKIRFVGLVNNPSDYYRKFDVFVLSTHYEGHPLSLFEAMSFGLPIVATRISSISEFISDGVNGLLVNPEEPEDLARVFQLLINDKSLLAKLGNAARKFFDLQPTIDDWSKQVLSLYEECFK